MQYIVYAKDNSDMDAPSHKVGEYEDAEAAIAACQGIVDRSLEEYSGSIAEEIYRQYCLWGEDAWIITDDPNCKFSGWDYAKERSGKIAKTAGLGTGPGPGRGSDNQPPSAGDSPGRRSGRRPFA